MVTQLLPYRWGPFQTPEVPFSLERTIVVLNVDRFEVDSLRAFVADGLEVVFNWMLLVVGGLAEFGAVDDIVGFSIDLADL